MEFAPALIEARLVRRYKRFLADVELADGAMVTVHCPNPGAMTGLDMPGLPVWLSDHAGKIRKLRYTLELVRLDSGMVGINTGLPNRLAADAILAGQIPELAGYATQRREVRYGVNSRIDLLLDGAEGRPPCYVEVKNVHLRRPDGPHPDSAEFPDCVTARGAKHLVELADMVRTGARSVMLYLVQRTDCTDFRIAGDIDPTYARGLDTAMAAGVEALCYTCAISTRSIVVDRPLPVVV